MRHGTRTRLPDAERPPTERLRSCGLGVRNALRRSSSTFTLTRCLVILALAMVGDASTARAESVAERFLNHVNSTDVPVDVRETIVRAWEACEDCDGEELVTQGLALMSVPFRAGLEAYDNDELNQCARMMADLSGSPDPFVALHAAAYEIKALVGTEELLAAGERVQALLEGPGERALRQYTYMAPEIMFLRGYCLLADLRYEKAMTALSDFISGYPDASERFLLPARQMLAELEARRPGKIGDVVDLMVYSRRRLTVRDSSEPVVERQEKIIELLDAMIEEAEQQEQSSSSSSGGGGGGGSSGGQAPSTPMQDSMLPGGAAPGEGTLRETRRASPGEAWGAMPEKQRQEILQALRDSFPGQYRRLVEQYYEELAKKP